MTPRLFAWFAGPLLVLIGLAGFAPPLVAVIRDPLRVAARVADPHLFGLFPVSPGLNLIHIGLGAWALLCARSEPAATRFARRAAPVLILLALAGTIPGLDTLFGAAPLYGNNLLLHGALGVAAGLVGWLYRSHPTAPAPAVDVEQF